MKLLRAEEHLEAIKRELAAYASRRPYGFIGEFDRAKSRYAFKVCVFEDPPLFVSVLIGEFLHNASSALEHIAWELVKLNGFSPNETKTGFPIFTSEEKWKRHAPAMMDGMSLRHRAEIESLQPFKRVARHAVDYDLLALLHNMWNIDKHRTLHATATVRTTADVSFIAVADCFLCGERDMTIGRYEHGAVIAYADIEITGDHPKVAMDDDSSIDIAFDDLGMSGARLGPTPVVDVLEGILTVVNEIYDRFLLDFPA